MEPRDKIIKGAFTIDKNAKITSRPKHLTGSLSSLRASSKGDPKDSLGETNNPYVSNLIPFFEDENAYAAKLKLDISKLQDEINKLDIDGKIRNPSSLELKKNYITVIQKWLTRNSDYNMKDLFENKLNFIPENEKLLEILNVKTPQDGLRKLFKQFSLFEILITKLSELQMMTLVKYDENFSSFIKTSAFNQVNQLSTGINLNRFPVFSVNLERFIELITFTNKIANEFEIKHQANKATIDVNTLSSKEELLEAIQNQDFRIFPEEATVLNKILKESIEKERQLNEEINILFTKNENSKEGYQEKIKNIKENSKNVKASNDPSYYLKIIDEVRDLFKEEIKHYDFDIKELSLKLMDSKIIIDDLKAKLSENEQKISIILDEKKKMMESFNRIVKNKDEEDRFEDVLREEFRNMQNGFEEKIARLTEDILNVKKEKGKEVLEMKQQLTREIETKNLLMKKLSTFINY